MAHRWTQDEINFLQTYYPDKGKQWCMKELGMTDGQIRQKASDLGLRQNHNSEFFKDWQTRAALSKVGKKRPEHAKLMRELYFDGKVLQVRESSETISKRVKEWLKTHEHPRGFLGRHHTQHVKDEQSLIAKRYWSNVTEEELGRIKICAMKTRWNNGTYARERPKVSWNGGKREVGGNNIYFRSKWEANYARYLEWLKINGNIQSWEHESEVFWFEGIKRGCVSYLPDFKIMNNDGSIEYHEVKGWMDARSKTKLKRMAKYYPDKKVVVISAKEYKAIEKSVSSLITDWE